MRTGLFVALVPLVVGVLLLLWHGEIQPARSSPPRQAETIACGCDAEPDEAQPPSRKEAEPDQAQPARTAPEDEVRWLTELPPAYRGNEFIRGVVVNERSQPVPGALVMCRPFRWVPFAEPHFKALARRTDPRGSFAFKSFPKAFRYEIAVISEEGYAIDRYGHSRATTTPLRIRISPVYYERIEFFDEDGKPQDVSQVFLRLARGGFVFGSDGPPPPIWLSRWFKAIGKPLVWEPHEAVYVYPVSAPYARHVNRDTPTTVRTIRPPGYLTTDVPELRRPLSEWPKPTGRVTLKKGPLPEGHRRYRCILPNVKPPAWWGSPQAYRRLSLMVGIGARESRKWFMPLVGREEFIGPVDRRIVVKLNSVLLLPFEQHEEDDVLVLKPGLERFGYLSLYYPASRGDRPGVGTLLYVNRDDGKNQPLAGDQMWPGFARFGPLPVGDYVITVRWADTAKPLDRPITITIREGWQRHDAR